MDRQDYIYLQNQLFFQHFSCFTFTVIFQLTLFFKMDTLKTGKVHPDTE